MTPVECLSHSAFNLNCCSSPVCLPSIYYTHEKTDCKRVILPELTKQAKNTVKYYLFVLCAK